MTTIEVYEGHEVTTAAISCNIGSGLLEAMKIDPQAYKGGELIDVVVRMRIDEIGYKPVNKDDVDGPWKRIHKAKPLAAVPVENTVVTKLLDVHIAKVSKRRELPGQSSIDDEIVPGDNVRGIKSAKKSAKKAALKKPAKAKAEPVAPVES